MARVVIESKVRARRQRRRAIIAASVAGAVLLMFIALAAAAHIPALRIRSVEIVGINSADEVSLLQAYVAQELSGNYLFVFPRDNALLYPQEAIQDGLLSDFSSLSSAEVTRVGLTKVRVAVSPRTPVALWCGEAVASSSPCFLADDQGLTYAALTLSGNQFDRYFGPLSGTSTRHYLTPTSFKALMATVNALKANDLTGVSSVLVDENKDVTVVFNDGFSILFALSDANVAYQRFLLALKASAFEQHALSEFSYVDLRFGDKLYYKLKGQ